MHFLYDFTYPEIEITCNTCLFNDKVMILDTREINLDDYPGLEIISRVGVGVDNVDLEECKRRGIAVYITPCSELTNAVADFTVMQMLNLLNNSNPRECLQQKRVLIIGYGRIGQAVHSRLVSFNVVVAVRDIRHFSSKEEYLIDLKYQVSKSDIVTIHTSGNDEIMGEELIDCMPFGGYLVNMARKQSLNFVYATLCYEGGFIAGIADDFYSSYCCFDGLLLTNHIASNTQEARKKMEELAVENILIRPVESRVV